MEVHVPSAAAARPRLAVPVAPGVRRRAARAAASLDGVRTAFWEAYRHLFPPQALAAQTAQGGLVVSWPVMDDPHAHRPYAAPVVLRFEPALLEAMVGGNALQRLRIASKHEPALRDGLRGYDPFARFPNARVITLG